MSEPMNVIAKDTEASAMPHGAAAAASVNNGGMIVMVVAVVSMVLNAVAFFASGVVLVAWLTQGQHVHDLDTFANLTYAHEVKVESLIEAHGDISKAGTIPKPPR